MTTLLPRTATRSRLRPRALLDSLTFPHGVEGYQDAFRPAVGARAMTATVAGITPRTPRANSILLRPEQPVTFAAGQHLLLTSQIDGVRRTRCYSLSDTPHRADGLLEVTVAHLPDGMVSSHLTQEVRIGDVLGLSAPQGHEFILPATRPAQVLLIGGGSGITPLRSMWRTMAAEGHTDRVTVLYYARTADDAIFLDEIRDLTSARVVLTREPGSGGRFTADHLATLDIDPATATTYVCGPTGLVDAVSRAWEALPGDPALHTESFAPAIAPTDPDAAGGVLTFARAGRSSHNAGRTLLDEAEAAGLSPAAGCRMGICHTCITTKHAGVVRDVRTGQDDDGGTCEVQLCITQAVGDVQLDL